ncbi:hypothetical protein KC19_VG336600 [Ceratodon purpureus]|uniref:DNA (cytosine-5-)-methyltransferase n=1 Tax=Ceratodon purpureus TaxID=3225 RepID=A0A8T0HW25_CERPU|nr:hypothetical protein KC19_VG336600 [Ceratodon purpureus]
MAGGRRSALIRGRPVKRDPNEVNAPVAPAKLAGTSSPTIVDLDDVPGEILVSSDTKRKKSTPKSSGKKQKVAAAAAAKPSGRGEVDDSGSLGDGNDNGAAASDSGAPEELDKDDVECSFIESSRIPSHVAKKDYPHRYVENDGQAFDIKAHRGKSEAVEEKPILVTAHYKQAEVEGKLYKLGDCVHIHSGLEDPFIGRITEFYEKEDKSPWFAAQWFFRYYDTGMAKEGRNLDTKRIFYSDVTDDNELHVIVGKVTIVRIASKRRFDKSPVKTPACDYYFDKGYKFAYTTFYELPKDLPEPPGLANAESNFRIAVTDFAMKDESVLDPAVITSDIKQEYHLLDLYCGCGAMSTGMCLGMNLAGKNLVTKWAVDLNEYACISLKNNHLETIVRNEAAEDYLQLLKEWQKLCQKYPEGSVVEPDSDDEDDDGEGPAPGEYEVERLLGIRWIGEVSNKDKQVMEQVDDMDDEDLPKQASAKKTPKQASAAKEDLPLTKGLEFKVRWKGYTPEHDTWEPSASLDHCPERVKQFVLDGRAQKLLPLPGQCDVICGGPPCQGASGFNRFRNKVDPLADPRNKQMVVYMDIVDFLRPRFFLMENVVDILKFCGGILGRYALARGVGMNYQSKVGIMVAGCYGMPQFRARCFLWGASNEEVLPPYPMPTHKVIVRGGVPQEWERCLVAYEENKQPEWLQKPLVLKDALSDLPPVGNDQDKDDIPYEVEPECDFQRFLRLRKKGTGGLGSVDQLKKMTKVMLPDHRPLKLNADDYQRVLQIPKKKGANFRDLKGILIKADGITVDVVRQPRELLPSGKPLVPDYAVSFIRGRSLKPFGRLWWDETVPTVVTRAEPHNQIILHPEQDRVLTIRENARLQGFPDYYALFGPIKQRYTQVGNAVAVPVATALGYALGQSFHRLVSPQQETLELPRYFPYCLTIQEHQ